MHWYKTCNALYDSPQDSWHGLCARIAAQSSAQYYQINIQNTLGSFDASLALRICDYPSTTAHSNYHMLHSESNSLFPLPGISHIHHNETALSPNYHQRRDILCTHIHQMLLHTLCKRSPVAAVHHIQHIQLPLFLFDPVHVVSLGPIYIYMHMIMMLL